MKFKAAGEGFFFPVSKAKSITGITDTNIGIKKKKSKPSATTYSTLGDMLTKTYQKSFFDILGDKVVITGGELGEWRLTQYQHGTIVSSLSYRPNDSPISIEHNCGPGGVRGQEKRNAGEDVDCWMLAWAAGDKRRKLCFNCRKRVPMNIRGLIKLIE